MRHLTRGIAALAVASLALLAVACNKGPAEAALAEADQALAAARPDLERYAPGGARRARRPPSGRPAPSSTRATTPTP